MELPALIEFGFPVINSIQLVPEAIESDLDSELKAKVMVSYNGFMYEVLIDTGAEEVSCVSTRFIKEQQLDISKLKGNIHLADQRVKIDRIGVTKPLRLSFFFLHSDLPEVELTHRFEIIEMENSYDFIIGTDLIPYLFPGGIPKEFISRKLLKNQPVIHSINLDSGKQELVEEKKQSVDLDSVIPVNKVNQSVLVDGLKQISQQIGIDGAGSIPSFEVPNRVILDTPPELEKEYELKREELSQVLQPLLEINMKITGFCNLPESVVELHVDPLKKNKLFRRQYPIPATLIPLVKEIVDRWFATGKIKFAPPNCPYNNPITVAPKKDDNGVLTAIRVCLDTRLVNEALILTDSFPLPKIVDSLEIFSGCCLFGEFDLSEAYLQFQLHPDSQPYTAFTFEGQQYMFVGCPFGIKSLPGYYQRIISKIFHDLKFTRPYIDNLPFGSRSWSEHAEHAGLILKRLNECNLKVKPKLKIGHSSLKILGHHISAQGIGLDPDKLKTLKDWPLPATGPDMESFLGFITFLCGNVRHFADLAAPLQAVKHEKIIPYNSNPLLGNHFNLIKEAIAKSITLQYPNFNRPFHLATDASNFGIGGVLFQPMTENEFITADNIVGLYSHKLTKTEQNYPAYRKELLGVVRSLLHFHYYLWGRKDTVVITDHKPLTFIKTSPQLSPALEQWLDVINNYEFKIIHRPGVLHVIPDQISRMYSSLYKDSNVWGIAENQK